MNKKLKARILDIRIGFQNNDTFDAAAGKEFSDALEWIRYYWKTKNMLPSFGDSISDNTGECFVVTGKAFFMNDYDTLEIYVMNEQEFLLRIFRTDEFTFKIKD